MPAHMKVTNTSKDLLASNEDGASTQSGFIPASQHWRRACDCWIPGTLAAGESERIGCSTGRQTKTGTVGWCGPVLHILHTYHYIPCRANQYLSSHVISVQIVGGINTGWLKEVFPGSFQRNQEWNLLEHNTIWNTLIIHFLSLKLLRIKLVLSLNRTNSEGLLWWSSG